MVTAPVVRVDKKNASWIIIDRQDVKNALDMNAANELSKALDECAKDANVKCVVLTGEGDVFCSGGDINAMHEAKEKGQYLGRLSRAFNRSLLTMRTMNKPVIAAINGPALGAGFSLVLGADLRIAIKGARFSMAYRNVGLAPGSGTYNLLKEIGYAKAAQLVLLGEVIDADEAQEIGLINEVVKSKDLIKVTDKYVKRLTLGPLKAIAMSKDLLNKAQDSTMSKHCEREAEAITRSGKSKDGKEGIAAFVEKRKARFQK